MLNFNALKLPCGCTGASVIEDVSACVEATTSTIDEYDIHDTEYKVTEVFDTAQAKCSICGKIVAADLNDLITKLIKSGQIVDMAWHYIGSVADAVGDIAQSEQEKQEILASIGIYPWHPAFYEFSYLFVESENKKIKSITGSMSPGLGRALFQIKPHWHKGEET